MNSQEYSLKREIYPIIMDVYFFFLPLSIFQYSLKGIRENKEKDLNVEFQLDFLKKLLNTA